MCKGPQRNPHFAGVTSSGLGAARAFAAFFSAYSFVFPSPFLRVFSFFGCTVVAARGLSFPPSSFSAASRRLSAVPKWPDRQDGPAPPSVVWSVSQKGGTPGRARTVRGGMSAGPKRGKGTEEPYGSVRSRSVFRNDGESSISVAAAAGGEEVSEREGRLLGGEGGREARRRSSRRRNSQALLCFILPRILTSHSATHSIPSVPPTMPLSRE
mmetsp:Transcript_31889/g.63162  ORF Transcript_31889/g.63162 Transcript_31889/m.63162 type:complete len:212 (-) Transcript_31889:32-667(-)